MSSLGISILSAVIVIFGGIQGVLAQTLRAEQMGILNGRIEEAKLAYTLGDLKLSIEKLESVVHELRNVRSNLMVSYLPSAPQGWQEQPVQAAGMMGMMGGNIAKREYLSEGKIIEVAIMADSPLSASLLKMVDALGGMATQEKYKGFTMDFKNSPEENEMILVLNENMLVMVEGKGLQREMAEQFLNKMDLAGLAKF